MKQLRWWFVATLLWCFLLYNLERIHEPLNIASFVYVFVAAIAVLVVSVPKLTSSAFAGLLAASAVLFLVLKSLLHYQIAGTGLPLTVMELAAIGVTATIARRTALCISGFELAATSALLAWLPSPQAHAAAEAEMYREVRRARRHNRPLSVVAIGPKEGELNQRMEHFLEELQQRNLRHYALARIGEAIAGSVRECDLISPIEGGFLLLLPELETESADRHVAEIVQQIEAELGLQLLHGIAEFPLEETTLAGLLERAEADLRRRLQFDDAPEAAPPSALSAETAVAS